MSIPEGFSTITPYLVVNGAAEAINFYEKALGAVVTHRQDHTDGRVRHAQFQIGNSHVMITDGSPEHDFMPPVQHYGGSPIHLFLYVEDADGLFHRGTKAGMSELMPMADQPYGRSGGVKDPFGIIWWITTAPEKKD